MGSNVILGTIVDYQKTEGRFKYELLAVPHDECVGNPALHAWGAAIRVQALEHGGARDCLARETQMTGRPSPDARLTVLCDDCLQPRMLPSGPAGSSGLPTTPSPAPPFRPHKRQRHQFVRWSHSAMTAASNFRRIPSWTTASVAGRAGCRGQRSLMGCPSAWWLGVGKVARRNDPPTRRLETLARKLGLCRAQHKRHFDSLSGNVARDCQSVIP